jgi:nitroimidazol reductase NimA-like FMN-containing flavoprotein (pyridoxamine 5'-phosphate oxidase superfamily)
MKLTKAELEFVGPARVARFATVDANGVPHNVPVCPVFVGGSFYFGTEARAKKVKNLEANGTVALIFDDYTEAWGHLRGIMIQGQARLVGKQEFRVMRKKLYAKFQQYETGAPLEEAESVIIEVSPRNKYSWGL